MRLVQHVIQCPELLLSILKFYSFFLLFLRTMKGITAPRECCVLVYRFMAVMFRTI
jgi:hypothetical protein